MIRKIVIKTENYNATGKMLARLLTEIRRDLLTRTSEIKEPYYSHLRRLQIQIADTIPTKMLLANPNQLLITDNTKYCSNPSKAFFCLGEVTSITEHQKIIFGDFKVQSFFNVEAVMQLKHLCEKAILMSIGLLPSFSFIYKPLVTLEEITELYNILKDPNSKFICASDIETSNKLITCISYTFINLNKPSKPISVCVDLIKYSEEIKINATNVYIYEERLKLIHKINSLPNVDFIFHNGTYDNTYLMKYLCPTNNFKYDTQHLHYSMHSMARKSLYNVSSAVNPAYRYWKDEIKGGEETLDKESKESMMPHSIIGYKRYLRYCALDSFFTLTNFFYQLQLCNLLYKHAGNNYAQVHRLMLIYMEWQFTEFPLNKAFLLNLLEEKAGKANKIKAEFRFLLKDILPDFNINSVKQKQTLFYDLLKAEPVRGSMAVNDKQLAQLAKQHTLIEYFVGKVNEYQKNNKFVSDFKNYLGQSSIGTKHSCMGTATSRANSKPNDFFRGRNLQNITGEVRPAFIAPQGYYIFDIDYSQADTYFVAATVDPKMFRVVTDDRDTHAVHGAQVFGVPYDEVVKRKKEKFGPRNLVKPISHGGNYFMTAITMYIDLLSKIGTSGLLSMADNLKLDRPTTNKGFIDMCHYALSRYRKQYQGLIQWGHKIYEDQIRNKGLMTSAFNFSTIFPIKTDPSKVDAPQREMAGFVGQAGTAGLMNRFLVNLYYKGYSKPFDNKDYSEDIDVKNLTRAIEVKDLIPMIQVHDSIVGFVKKDKLSLLDNVISLMERPINIKGQEFYVPTECEIGTYWSKKDMSAYSKGEATNFDHSKIK